MQMPTIVPQQRGRFYDGGSPTDDSGAGGDPPAPTAELEVKLERRLEPNGDEVFLLGRRIAYDDRHVGEIVVPTSYAGFKSDLTSVPRLFTWLVPKTGSHLPAALIHDGLIWDPADEEQTYVSTEGRSVDRVEADRVFRDGMADTGTGLVRRWLVWTAVTLATMLARQDTSSRRWVRWYYAVIVILTLGTIVWLGYLATADLFDRSDSWWLAYEVAWMSDRGFWTELVTGAAGAVVVPAVLGLLWGKFVRAGWIAGFGVGLLFHVTIALVVVSAAMVALEWLAARVGRALLLAGAVTVFVGAVVVFAGAAL
jgi:hypothetical protein